MSVEHDDAISDGWLCDRGRYNVGFYASPDRITQPLYRKDGAFVQIGWDDAFIAVAKAIADAIAAREPASVGAIGGGRLTNEEAYACSTSSVAIGVTNLDWRAGRQRQATPGGKGGALAAIDGAHAIVVAGESIEERAPVLWLRVRKAARGAARTVVHAATPAEALAAIPAGATRVALVWDGIDLERGRAFAEAFADVAELVDLHRGEQANARGAEAMGMLPKLGPGYVAAALPVAMRGMFDAARNGELAVLSMFGVNPVRNAATAPRPSRRRSRRCRSSSSASCS